MEKGLFLGLFLTLIFVLVACGNGSNDNFTSLKTEDLKKFVEDGETGFILFTYDNDDAKANKDQVSKALNSNDKSSYYFDYRDQVTNKQSQTFRSDVGTDQSRDSLGYYQDGELMAEFEFPNEWSTEKVDDLNKFVKQISE